MIETFPNVLLDRLLSQSRTYLALVPPKPRTMTSWAQYVINKIPLKTTDLSYFLEESADLVALAPAQERSSLDSLIECLVDWCTKKNILHVRVLAENDTVTSYNKMKCITLSPEKRAQCDARYISFLIRNKVDLTVRAILVFVVVGLLSTPMMVLPYTHNSKTLTFFVVTLYTTAFSICLSATTLARRQDHFAICAAVSSLHWVDVRC